MFYTEVNKFKKITDIEQMVVSAKEIFHKFLAPKTAPFEINASRQDMQLINTNLDTPQPNMFDRIEQALVRGNKNTNVG